MGVWGQRWARGDVVTKRYDASLLMWDIHRNVDGRGAAGGARGGALPPARLGATRRATSGWCWTPRPSTCASPTRVTTSTSRSPVTWRRWSTTGWGASTCWARCAPVTWWWRDRGPLVAGLPTWFSRSAFAPVPHAAGRCRWRVLACPRGPRRPTARARGVGAAHRRDPRRLPRCRQESAWTGTRWRVGRRDGRPRLRRGGPGLPDHLPRASPTRWRPSSTSVSPTSAPGGAATSIGLVLDDDTDWDELAELLTDSYCVQAPAHLAERVARPQ